MLHKNTKWKILQIIKQINNVISTIKNIGITTNNIFQPDSSQVKLFYINQIKQIYEKRLEN
jgi:hypothetical protein